ncbi:F-box protein skip1 [Thalictrum thalictroides]|uniref:F-box protein skip1 n=1 Tax=Thalictrum thalictroides TaxID=46969 RepID=A0A7J6W6H2_THATH|nr:F-box protein skip1 [Thalictrum thalictroides]
MEMEGNEEIVEFRGNSDWAELTHECLINILSRLSLEDRWKGGSMFVCKSWFDASKDPCLFSSVFDLESLFESGAELPLWWSPSFETKIDSMLRSVVDWVGESLKVIRVRHCSDQALAFLAERCPNLEVLSIKSCPNVKVTSIAKIASGCPMLSDLDISYCYEVSHESLELIGRKCPNLKTLRRNLMNWLDPSQHVGVPNEYLNACPQNGNEEAAAISKFMPQLKHLELRFSKLSTRGLVMLSEGCVNLEYLDLFGCANLTSRDMETAFTNLKYLKKLVKPNFYIPRSVFHTERYGHWNLYDERFQTNVFQI